MLKGNSYILIFSAIIFLIILFVSSTPILVKTLLVILTIGFLFPYIRRILFKDRFRKIKVAFYSSVIFTTGLFLLTFLTAVFNEQSFHFSGEFIPSMIIVLIYSLIGNFVYGLPVSLIAEFISMKFANIRFWLSAGIHIGFGLVTYFIVPEFTIPAVICSVIFFTLLWAGRWGGPAPVGDKDLGAKATKGRDGSLIGAQACIHTRLGRLADDFNQFILNCRACAGLNRRP